MCVLKLSQCFVCVGGMWEALAGEGRAYRGVLRRCEWGRGVVLTHAVSRRGAVMPRGLAWVCVTPRSDSHVLPLAVATLRIALNLVSTILDLS